MSKIKVLQFSIGNVRGGVTQYALNNWNFIDKNKFQFDFVTFGGKLDFEEELTEQGCKVHYISCYAEDEQEKFATEINRMLENNYDALHLHTEYWRSFFVEELAIKYGVPKIIIHSHNSDIDVDGITPEERARLTRQHEAVKRQISPALATDFWACSRSAADWLFGEQIPSERIRYLPNAVLAEAYSYKAAVRDLYRKQFDLAGCFVVGHVGRFARQKNHAFLIEVFRGIADRMQNARLLLIGIGPLEDEIRERVRECDLTERVLFLGKRDDVHGLLQAMDVFVLPSRFEGLPIVLVEAQAAGLQCVASVQVTREADITGNVAFSPLEVEAWQEAILQIAAGYERKCMDAVIKAAGYDLKQQIKVLEELYAEGRA